MVHTDDREDRLSNLDPRYGIYIEDAITIAMQRLHPRVIPAVMALAQLPADAQPPTPGQCIAVAEAFEAPPSAVLALHGYVLARDPDLSEVTTPKRWRRQQVYHRLGDCERPGGAPMHTGLVNPEDEQQLLALGIRRAILPDDYGSLSKLGKRPAVGRGRR